MRTLLGLRIDRTEEMSRDVGKPSQRSMTVTTAAEMFKPLLQTQAGGR